jgi:hypothetical protein
VAKRAVRRQTPKVRAVCGNPASTDLCGGRSEMGVPTANTSNGGFGSDVTHSPRPQRPLLASRIDVRRPTEMAVVEKAATHVSVIGPAAHTVPASSSPMSREQPTTSGARIAARWRVDQSFEIYPATAKMNHSGRSSARPKAARAE